MQAQFGMLLYLVAKNWHDARGIMGRGPRQELGITKGAMEEEVIRHLGSRRGYSRDVINQGCAYLIRNRYCQLKGGKASKRYILHERYALPALAISTADLTIVETIADLADTTDKCPLDAAIGSCLKPLANILTEGEIERRILALSGTPDTPGYFLIREEGTLEVNRAMVEEERPYFECIRRWGFRTPKPSATARATRQAARRSR